MDLQGCNPDVLWNLGSRCQSVVPLDTGSTCNGIAKRGKYGLRVRRLRDTVAASARPVNRLRHWIWLFRRDRTGHAGEKSR